MDADLILSLSPYEVAVLAFTSPDAFEHAEEVVTLTSKDAYLWAGAVAHVLIRKPRTRVEELAENVEIAVDNFTKNDMGREVLLGRRVGRTTFYDSGLPVIKAYLSLFGLEGEIDDIKDNVEDAVSSLELRGLIVDPINKKIGAAIVSVAMILPVSYTSTTEEGTKINAVTWEYTEQVQENDKSHYEFRLKTREASEVVFKKIVPAFASAIDTMIGEQCESKIDLKSIQSKLRDAGYYGGKIDGKFGPITSRALRTFQSEKFLRVTGHLDEKTVCAINDI
ncbi:MAG: peptidoglycan-binding domain-containing protein [Candidatus Thiodiazotropha sp.]